MTHKVPGKAHREGITVVQLADMFPDEAAATAWFESQVWPSGRHCPRCGSINTSEASHAKMPYWCTDCRSYFSVKAGTVMEGSKLPLRKWVFRDLPTSNQPQGRIKHAAAPRHRRPAENRLVHASAYFVRLGRMMTAWPFAGPIETDETYMGGKESNKHSKKKLRAGRGGIGKAAVVGAKDRATNKVKAKMVKNTDAKTLQKLRC